MAARRGGRDRSCHQTALRVLAGLLLPLHPLLSPPLLPFCPSPRRRMGPQPPLRCSSTFTVPPFFNDAVVNVAFVGVIVGYLSALTHRGSGGDQVGRRTTTVTIEVVVAVAGSCAGGVQKILEVGDDGRQRCQALQDRVQAQVATVAQARTHQLPYTAAAAAAAAATILLRAADGSDGAVVLSRWSQPLPGSQCLARTCPRILLRGSSSSSLDRRRRHCHVTLVLVVTTAAVSTRCRRLLRELLLLLLLLLLFLLASVAFVASATAATATTAPAAAAAAAMPQRCRTAAPLFTQSAGCGAPRQIASFQLLKVKPFRERTAQGHTIP